MKLVLKLLSPMDSFCCGCSLDFGIKLILLYQSVSCAYELCNSFGSLVLDAKMFAHSSPASEAFSLFCALASIPFLGAGWSGLWQQIETHLRIYLAWLLANLGLDIVMMAFAIAQTSCAQLPGTAAGSAYACGTMRIFNFCYLSMWLSISVYCIFIVWSRCHELQAVESSDSFKALALQAERKEKAATLRRLQTSGLFGVGEPTLAPSAVVYGSLASPIVEGSAKIFGGQHHDTDYPPTF